MPAHRARLVKNASLAKPVKRPRPLLAKSAHLAPHVKSVLHAHPVKSASHVAIVKTVRYVNCVSLWMPPPPLLLPLLP